ncbi:MAG: LuxR C-terminal-related transcriptional regulator [Elainellaceae cyanobacterium]
MLNSTRLLLDLQHVNAIAQRLSGASEPHAIASHVTDGLVELFGCAFARIWLTEPSQTHLKLIASSGLYTHTNGSFARVPMGAYKVGKIAQNRVPFLSNQLADESWVKDRDWAIANGIKGFAGYPLIAGNRVTGVLATFSRHPMAPEFLEVLQVLCMTTTIALDAAQTIGQMRQSLEAKTLPLGTPRTLSDRLSEILTGTRLLLVGTEQPMLSSVGYTFLRLTELLAQLGCSYCRLTYGDTRVTLEAIATLPAAWDQNQRDQTIDSSSQELSPPPHQSANGNGAHAPAGTEAHPLFSQFQEIQFMATCGSGSLTLTLEAQDSILDVRLQMPYVATQSGTTVRIQCQRPVLQTALTHLAFEAGLSVCSSHSEGAIAITDREDVVSHAAQAIWVQHRPNEPIPSEAKGVIDLSIQAAEFATLVHQVSQGEIPSSFETPPAPPSLSNREQEVLALLAQGFRDRDIAQRLYISESTVKFHLNNGQTKLSAKNRYEAVYKAAIQGVI